MSQSIADDITMTKWLWQEHIEMWYLIHYVSILFMVIFMAIRVRKHNAPEHGQNDACLFGHTVVCLLTLKIVPQLAYFSNPSLILSTC